MSAIRSSVHNRIHEEFYATEVEAQERVDQVLADPDAEGVILAKAQNHDWMQDGEVYWMVRWVNPWHPIDRESDA